MDAGGGLDLRVKVSGRKVTDPRDSTYGVSRNPVVIAHDILTGGDPWAESLAPSDVDSASLATAADWCDDAMADGTARYAIAGVIRERDPWTAARAVLDSAHIGLVEYAGKVRFVAERDADTPTGIVVPADGWIEQPEIEPADPDIPDAVRVRYLDTESRTQKEVVAGADQPQATIDEVALELVGDASVARRWGEQYLRTLALPYVIRGVLGPEEAADLLPGDIITVSTQTGLQGHQVRVLAIEEEITGRYRVVLRSRVVGTEGTETSAEDAAPASMTGPGWETGPPQAPSNVSVTVATVEVADNVTAPVLDISWTEPSGGPAISHYEVRLGTRLLAKVPAGANSATVAAQGTGTQQVAVYAVGLDGSRSAAATKNVTITGGAIAQIQGKAVTSTFSIRGFLAWRFATCRACRGGWGSSSPPRSGRFWGS